VEVFKTSVLQLAPRYVPHSPLCNKWICGVTDPVLWFYGSFCPNTVTKFTTKSILEK